MYSCSDHLHLVVYLKVVSDPLSSKWLITNIHVPYLTYLYHPSRRMFSFFFKPFWYMYAVYVPVSSILKMRLLPHDIFYNLELSDFSLKSLSFPFLLGRR